MHNHKNLQEIHENVPAEHYDRGIKGNLFQWFWHSRRFHEVLKVVKKVDGPVLDLGCHSGTFTSRIVSKVGSKKIFGLDISSGAIKLASQRMPFGNFQLGDAHRLSYKSAFFDEIFCLEMLEHVDNPVEVLSEIYRVLKKNGYAIILVPSESKLFKLVWFLWTFYYPVWKHAHVQSFQNSELESLLKKVGFNRLKSKKIHLGMLKLIVCQK